MGGKVYRLTETELAKACRKAYRLGQRKAEAKFDALLERLHRLKELNGTTSLFKAEWDESKHPRDGGKFAVKGQNESAKGEAPANRAPSVPAPDADYLLDGLHAHVPAGQWAAVRDAVLSVAQKVHERLVLATPAFLKLQHILTTIGDHPDDLKTLGYKPVTSGVAGHDTPDAFRDATGISGTIGARLAAHVLAKAVSWVRTHTGAGKAVDENADPYTEAGEALADVLAMLAEAFGLDGELPDGAAVADALRAAESQPEEPGDPHASALIAMLDHAIQAAESGGDVQAGLDRIVDAMDDGEQGDGDAVEKAFDSDKHPRDDHGRFVSKDAIQAAQGDPAKAEELRKRVTNPEQRKKLDAAISGEVDVGRTKRGEAKHQTAERRKTRQASKDKAREILHRVGSFGEITADDVRDLADHLPAMTLAELRLHREALMAKLGGKRVKQGYVDALLNRARGSVPQPSQAERMDAELSPDEQRAAALDARMSQTTPDAVEGQGDYPQREPTQEELATGDESFRFPQGGGLARYKEGQPAGVTRVGQAGWTDAAQPDSEQVAQVKVGADKPTIGVDAQPAVDKPVAPVPSSPVHSATVVTQDRGGKKEKLVSWPFHAETIRGVRDGILTADDLKRRFAELTADPTAVKAHIAEQLKKSGLRSPEKIERQASEIYDRALSAHTLGQSISYRMPLGQGAAAMDAAKLGAYKQAMEGITDEHVAEARQRYESSRADHAKRVAEAEKAMTNPETLDEFRQFLRRKPQSDLTPEQLAKWDHLEAAERRAKDAAERERRAVVAGVNVSGVGYEIHQGFHTKHNKPIHIVKLGGRVDGETFKTLAESARKLGGNYQQNSKWTRGASPDGFNFDTREQAERFGQLLSGQSVSRLEDWDAAQSESRQATANRLQALADRSEESARDALSRDRLTNTARRAEHAASAEAGARVRQAFAQTVRRVAEKIASGEAEHLNGVRAGTHLEALDAALRQGMYARDRKENTPYDKAKGRDAEAADVDHAPYPHPWFTGGDLYRLAGRMKETPGAKRLGERIRKLADSIKSQAEKTGRDGDHVTDPAILQELSDVARNPSAYGLDKFQGDMMRYKLNDYMRLQAADIKTPGELRAALREYLPLKQKPAGEDPVKAAERSLVGRKIAGFFPTPRPAVDDMLSRADIQPGMSVLEPSAGKGDILDAIKEQHPDAQTVAVEPVGDLRTILGAKGHNLVGSDFLQHTGQYDRVVMNPPFENGQDIDHVRHAYDQLKPGGRLVAIMSEGPFSRGDSKAAGFRDWLDSVQGEHEQMPEGSFAGPDAFRQTGVRTRLVTINKPQPTPDILPGGRADRVPGAEQPAAASASALRAKVEANNADPQAKPITPQEADGIVADLRAKHSDDELKQVAKQFTGKSGRNAQHALQLIYDDLVAVHRALESQKV